jgi:hypothetical protein
MVSEAQTRTATMRDAPERISDLEPIPRPNKSGPPAEVLRGLLEHLQKLCDESGEAFTDVHTRITQLQERLIEERFNLAVLGQFKRGKSTLLNALLGEPLLPTGVVPLTSIPTFLRGGETRVVRIFFHDGRQAEFAALTAESDGRSDSSCHACGTAPAEGKRANRARGPGTSQAKSR